jgi:hypothetical protein
MRQVQSPPLAPRDRQSQATYIVLDDFGRAGQAYRETDPDSADRETLIPGPAFGPV